MRSARVHNEVSTGLIYVFLTQFTTACEWIGRSLRNKKQLIASDEKLDDCSILLKGKTPLNPQYL